MDKNKEPLGEIGGIEVTQDTLNMLWIILPKSIASPEEEEYQLQINNHVFQMLDDRGMLQHRFGGGLTPPEDKTFKLETCLPEDMSKDVEDAATLIVDELQSKVYQISLRHIVICKPYNGARMVMMNIWLGLC